MKTYAIGNCLRGYFEGEFDSIDKAWKHLSKRFNISFPSKGGRHVVLFVEEKNNYGFNQFIRCKSGLTHMKRIAISKKEILKKCKYSNFYV